MLWREILRYHKNSGGMKDLQCEHMYWAVINVYTFKVFSLVDFVTAVLARSTLLEHYQVGIIPTYILLSIFLEHSRF